MRRLAIHRESNAINLEALAELLNALAFYHAWAVGFTPLGMRTFEVTL